MSGIPTDGLDLDMLRARRAELQALDDAVSYVRRVAQGRADLVRAELLSRRGGRSGPPAPPHESLRDTLADRLLGGPGRPPRPVEEHSDHPLAEELDQRCAERGFGRFRDLHDAALEELAGAIDGFERRVSARRQEVFGELDALTDELVRRLAATVQPDGDR